MSSGFQKDGLQSQMNYLMNFVNSNGIIPDELISEVGSGLNYKRKKWNQLLVEVEEREIDKIYVTYKDRFVRFGFDWFQQFCERHGTEIVVLNNPKTSPETELVNDLISIIHVFSCRIYGLRRYNKELKDDQNLRKEVK